VSCRVSTLKNYRNLNRGRPQVIHNVVDNLGQVFVQWSFISVNALMQDSLEMQQIWLQAIAKTKRRSPVTFEQWFSGVQFDGLKDNVLLLSARDEFVRDWVHDHYLPDLVDQLAAALGGQRVTVRWQVRRVLDCPVAEPQSGNSSRGDNKVGALDALDAVERPRISSRPPAAGRVIRSVVPPRPDRLLNSELWQALNPKFTFDNFIVGPSNELAYAAARAVADTGGARYNPLFIAGGTGLGKTHLMHAIAHTVLLGRAAAKVMYVSAERFTNEFIEALQHHRMDEFRLRYRTGCDVLLVDDVQFLAGREQTQEEFFHTFNALRDANRQIVVSADKYPHQLQRMPERLASRFTSGLVADVQVPQLETRVAIVRKKAQLERIDVPDEVALLLAQCVQSNVRELEGALIRLAAKSSLTGRPIDEEFARAELMTVGSRRPDPTSVADIQKAVCGHFRLSNSELLSKDRHKSVAFARQVAMYLCRQRLKCSFPELGRAFGNRDHTTVLSAVRRVEALRNSDPQVAAHLEAIEKKLASSDE
jgi:chromosomal replication initiator protein